MEDPSVSAFSKPKKKKSFSKEEPVGSDPEETAAVEVFPKGSNLSPKRNQLVTLKRQVTEVCPRKRGLSIQGPASQQWS